MKRPTKVEWRRSLIPADMDVPRPAGEVEPMPAESTLSGEADKLFSMGFIRDVLSSKKDKYRARILKIEIVALMVLSFVIKRLMSFRELVQELRSGELPGLQEVEVTPQAFFKRLKAIHHSVFLEVLRQTTRVLAASQKHIRPFIQALAPFAGGVYAVDDTTLDALMRRTPELKALPKGDMKTLAGRLGCAVDLLTGKVAEVMFDDDAKANEKNHILPLVERLEAGVLYVMDLGYFSFKMYDELTDHFTYFVTRARKNFTFERAHVITDTANLKDRIIYLGKYRSDRAAHPVRLVEMRIKGTWWRYLTNVHDPKMLPPEKLWALYAQRWNIEQSFAALKRSLGMAYLRASHTNGVLIQVWCTLAVYQVLQDLRLDIAASQGWPCDDVSWEILMRRIAWYAGQPGDVSLRDWLVRNASRFNIRKTGTRKRGLGVEDLPPMPRPGTEEQKPLSKTLHPRKPRARLDNKRTRMSLTVVAGLS